MNFKLLLFNLIFSCCIFSNSQSMEKNSDEEASVIINQEENIILGNRPSKVQAAVDKAFEQNRNATKGDWFYNGSSYYGLLNINEDLMLEHLASENSEKKDIYIIDVGCAQGDWGIQSMRTILQHEASKKSGKRFHIFSVTGGQECDEMTKQEDHVTLYQLNLFKIENIDEELLKRGFDIKEKVDLIVSNWTLRHLVDPLGALKRMYSLLAPNKGMLFSNGFLFMFNDSDEVKSFPLDSPNILTNANTTLLFRQFTTGRDADQFLLLRNNQNELQIPLAYTGNIHDIGSHYQNASEIVTVFEKRPLLKTTFKRKFTGDFLDLYFDKDNQQSENLYNTLKHANVFYTKK